MPRRSARFFERGMEKIANLKVRSSRSNEPDTKKVIIEADQSDILTNEMRQYPVYEQLFILTERMADENPIVVLRHLNELLSLVLMQCDGEIGTFSDSVIKGLISYFSTCNTIQESNSFDELFSTTFRLYRTLQKHMQYFNAEYKHRYLGRDDDNFYNRVDKYLIRLLIIENMIRYLLSRISGRHQKLDIAFLNAIKIVGEMRGEDAAQSHFFKPVTPWAIGIAARICIHVLTSYSADLSDILELLFSYMIENQTKAVIVDSICAAIELRERHVSRFLFTADELRNAYKKKVIELERQDVNIVEDSLGEGCIGEVFEAHKENDPHPLAIKFYFRSKDAIANNAQSLFLKNANHPGVANCLFIIERNMQIGYGMSLAQSDLHRYIVDRVFDSKDESFLSGFRISFSSQIIQGLSYIASLNYVHHDFKPENILVYNNSPYPDVKIADMDLMTMSGHRRKKNRCTLSYSSPEDHVIGSICETSSDIYSFGGVMYFLCTGESPWQNIYEDWDIRDPDGVIKMKIISNENPTLCENIKLSDFSRLISWCWKYTPSERPTLNMLVDEIKKLSQPTVCAPT